VSLKGVCHERVCHERVCYERVCHERVCHERVCHERVYVMRGCVIRRRGGSVVKGCMMMIPCRVIISQHNIGHCDSTEKLSISKKGLGFLL